MTMVFPSWAFAEYLLAAVATILDKLTATIQLVDVSSASGRWSRLTRAVDLGHHKASENDLVEGGIGTACKASVHNLCAYSDRLTYEPGTCTDAPTT